MSCGDERSEEEKKVYGTHVVQIRAYLKRSGLLLPFAARIPRASRTFYAPMDPLHYCKKELMTVNIHFGKENCRIRDNIPE